MENSTLSSCVCAADLAWDLELGALDIVKKNLPVLVVRGFISFRAELGKT